MRHYSESFLREVRRFDECARQPGTAAPSDLGIHQFHEYESHGRKPDQPDPYYLALVDGKKWWEWTLNEYAKRFGTSEWFGWQVVEADFEGDPAGLRQVKARCLRKPMEVQV